MKKIMVLMLVLLFAGASWVSAEEIKKDCSHCMVLLGADVVLAGLATWAIMDQVSASTDYETLRSKIDGTTEANYYRLMYEQEKVNGRSDIALIAGGVAGAAILFTIADYFFLHNIFPADIKTGFAPSESGAKISMKKEF